MKPGYKTTEFWLTAIASILGALVPIVIAYGLLTAEEAEMWLNLILAVAAVVVPIVLLNSATKYTQSRTSLKETEALVAAEALKE
jgi:VIT1/CCC1 family predicted Fe2+/Mn2+ transporter